MEAQPAQHKDSQRSVTAKQYISIGKNNWRIH